LTLVGAHGSIVEFKMEIADSLPFLIPDLTVGPSVVGLVYRYKSIWDSSQVLAKHLYCRQLEGWLFSGALWLQMRDPHGAISRCAADRSIAFGKDLTVSPSKSLFCMSALQVTGHTQHGI
jgi:hypothetical protein